jgi:hypothetical protein
MKYFRFWLREIAGWLLVALGVFGFYVCLHLLLSRYILEAGSATVISVVMFRGGIHLLKVAVAARVCMQAAEKVAEQRPPVTPAGTKTTVRPTTVREPHSRGNALPPLPAAERGRG